MSEFINNKEHRQKALKEIILELHSGKTVDEVKARFAELIKGVTASEIAEMEQALIKEGMPVSHIQNLCDVHASVFKGSIEEIHREHKPEETPGHPVHTFKLENKEIEKLLNLIKPQIDNLKVRCDNKDIGALKNAIEALAGIDKHYSRKENLLFPFMEKHDITAPPKVMWGVDDEIRTALKEALSLLNSNSDDLEPIIEKTEEAVNKASEMIFKEENILFPMVLEALSEDEWLRIRDDSGEIGYFMVTPGDQWKPVQASAESQSDEAVMMPANGTISFEPGFLTPEEIKCIFNTLPFDITFVDKEGTVKYFTQGKERIFARPASIIGRQVANCHPPASVHVVEKIVEELESGKKDNEDFWIKMGDQFVYIRYFAVRNDIGEFLGIIEVTQNIKPIQDINGEKRLVSE